MGGAGMFAYDMCRIISANESFEPVPFDLPRLDITNHLAVCDCVSSLKPFGVINTVGPLVDPCEDDPEMAERINVKAVANLAAACKKVKARFVHLSSCGLFGDEKKAYRETDPVVLKTVYARTKYEGELAAQEAYDQSIIVRPGWMYGATVNHKKNFVAARVREAQKKPVMQSASDKFGSPTWTGNAAAAVMQLMLSSGLRGVFNLANTGSGSRADYVRCIVEAAGLPTKVLEVDSSAFSRKSPVPDCEILDNSKLNKVLTRPMPDWREAVRKYVGEEIKL